LDPPCIGRFGLGGLVFVYIDFGGVGEREVISFLLIYFLKFVI